MAITLTNNYQLISTIPLTYGEIRTYAKVNSQSKVENVTSYNLKMTYYLRQWIEVSSWNTNLDGTETSGGYTRFNAGETPILEVPRTIQHNNDGSSPTKSIYTGWYATFGGTGEIYAEIQMPKIARIPTITLADSFNDESDPTIEFTNPASFVIKPSLDFYYTTDTTKALHSITRDIGITSPYTFEISDEERKELRNKLNDKKEYVVRYNLNTYDENDKHIEKTSVDRTFTFINAEPTFTSSFEETDEKVINVLGTSAAKIIKNASKVKTTINPSAKKGATIKSVEIIHGASDVVLTDKPYEQVLTALTETFEVVVTDSRGYVVSETIIKGLIDYSPIEISQYSFKRVNPTSSDIELNANVKYMQQTFNTTKNTPTLQWKLGVDGELKTLSSDDYTIDTERNEITINNLLLNDVLPYTQQGTFYLLVNDLLTSDTENELVIVGIPVFDYGEFDLQVNGDLFIADRNRQNAMNVKDLVVDSLEDNSTTNAPSQRAVNDLRPVTLFNNPDGTAVSVTLTDDAENYEYLEIFYSLNGGTKNKSVRHSMELGDVVVLDGAWCTGDGTIMQFQSSEFLIKAKIMTQKYARYVNSNTMGAPAPQDNIFIKRVLGYKYQ